MGEFVTGLMQELCLRQVTLAERLEGVPYDTVRGWASGRADPGPANRQKLAAFIRQHAARLLVLAEELER